MDLDHLFVCCAVGAPEAERLLRLGLVEGTPNQHPGQGTANRRFFFHNAFLELLWVADPAEASSELVHRTGLWDRWRKRGEGVSPFGVCLRPATQPAPSAPFPSWEYRPPYLPAPLVVRMGENSESLAEPLLFYIAFGRRADAVEPSQRPPIEHAMPWRSITRVRITGPQISEISPTLQSVERQCRWFEYAAGDARLLEIGFDHERASKLVDLRPDLPLVCRW